MSALILPMNQGHYSTNERLSSFTNWRGEVNKEKLAEAGFLYTQINDVTQCPECGLKLDLWKRNDNPLDEHKLRKPDCPFVRRVFGTDLCGIRNGIAENSIPPTFRHDLKSRLDTFKDWPKQLNQKPKDLAQAGFYYTGEGDKVICFLCGVGLNEWESEDDVWFEHKKWSPNCAFLMKGGNRNFLETYKEPKKCEPIKIPENMNCIVCEERPRNVLSLPCKHLSTCEECNEKLDTCPICNRQEDHRIKVFIP